MTQLNVYQKEPNLYLTESPAPPPPGGADIPVGVGAMFGVAQWGPVGLAIYCTSFAMWETIFGGYLSTTYPSHSQVKKFFQNGGNALWFTRIVHYSTISDSTSKASISAWATLMVTSTIAFAMISAKYDGTRGNTFSMVTAAGTNGVANEFQIQVQEASVLAEPVYDNLSKNSTDPNYFVNVINARSGLIVANAPTTTAAISLAINTLVSFYGGNDGLATLGTIDYIGDNTANNGIKSFNGIDIPLLIACPDADMTVDATVRKEISRYCDYDHLKLNFGILCIPQNKVAVAALSYQTTTMATDSDRSAIYYPWVYDEDGTLISPTGAIMGVYSWFANAVTKGVWWSPAGTDASLVGVTGMEFNPGAVMAGKLNESRVNCLKSIPGTGICIWGSRTMSIANQLDFRYIGARLNTSDLEARILKKTLWAVHRPNDQSLWNDITATVKSILNIRYMAGGLDGATVDEAYQVICDKTVNTTATKLAGLVTCRIGIKNKMTAEFIWFNVAQLASGLATISE